jgi:hypothetical protein
MTRKYAQFLQFLQEELSISSTSIELGQRRLQLAEHQCEANLSLLPIVLWQYGLVSLEQLDAGIASKLLVVLSNI